LGRGEVFYIFYQLGVCHGFSFLFIFEVKAAHLLFMNMHSALNARSPFRAELLKVIVLKVGVEIDTSHNRTAHFGASPRTSSDWGAG
jgi:hypothetical protein